MLLTEEVKIRVSPKTIDHYLSLGYKIPMKRASESYSRIYHKEYVYDFSIPITVNIKDLTKGCSVEVSVLCDYCQEEIITMTYATYLKSLEHINKNSCKKCKGKKEEEYFLMAYGVKNPSQLDEFKEKYRATCIEKFGADNYFKTEEFDKKRTESMNAKYGVKYPLQSEEIQERWKSTCMDKYGASNPAKSQDIKDKAAITNIERYGGVAPAKSPEVREKMVHTLYENSSQMASKQQRYINNLYQGILNFPVKYYNVDIYLPEDNLTIEYDGGFHLGNVITGRETIEEHSQKEIIRNNVIKREGYKQMRIISSNDKLPSDTALLQMLSEARNYFSEYPNHNWIEFNLDTSLVRNAENKQGIPYDFGTLRRIKDEDLQQQITKKGA